MRMLGRGEDPREVFGYRHRERGPAKHAYTYKDLSALLGVAESTVRTELTGDSPIEQVAVWIVSRLSRKSIPLTEDEGVVVMGEHWRNRWPKVDLFTCGYPRCKSILPYQGCCPVHGGPALVPLTAVDPYGKLQFALRTDKGRKLPLHRLAVGPVAGKFVCHIDRNPLNNRPENLKIVDSFADVAEHYRVSPPHRNHQPTPTD
jgi:hypothetical protein